MERKQQQCSSPLNSNLGTQNAVSQVTTSDNGQLFSLSQQVQHLTEAVAQLQLSMLKDKEGTMSSKRPPVCWRCGKEGHLKRDCQQRKVADRPTGRRWGRGLKSFAVSIKGTPAVTVEGKVDGYPIRMLVDMGSMVTLLREDYWSEMTSISGKKS